MTPGFTLRGVHDMKVITERRPIIARATWTITRIRDLGDGWRCVVVFVGALRNDSIFVDLVNGEPIDFESRHVITHDRLHGQG